MKSSSLTEIIFKNRKRNYKYVNKTMEFPSA